MSGGGPAAPVFALYRSILRVHRSKLPTPVRDMGDRYVREEFASHLRGKTTESQWKSFMDEWQRYRGMLTGVADLSPEGTVMSGDALITGIDQSGDISEDAIAQMSPDQIARLQKMREEAVKFGKGLMPDETPRK